MDYKQISVIITTMSIALFMANVMIPNGVLRSEAAKSTLSNDWCYVSAYPEDRWVCFQDHKECDNAYALDLFKLDSCLKDNS
ncbi:MAG: hypothetical protein ACRD9Q_05545 [Nitrososphaeraceae archaeon]